LQGLPGGGGGRPAIWSAEVPIDPVGHAGDAGEPSAPGRTAAADTTLQRLMVGDEEQIEDDSEDDDEDDDEE
jgi:hypothetical protein